MYFYLISIQIKDKNIKGQKQLRNNKKKFNAN
jgi:hypothetical protein